MHIVQILPELNQGGVERHVTELNAALVGMGHRSTVISAGGKQVEEIEHNGGQHLHIDVCSKNPLTAISRAIQLQSQLATLNPDILHAHSRVPAWLCRFANRRLRIPFVTTAHGFNHVSPYSKVMTTGDAVVCVSNAVREYLRIHYGTPSRNMTVIPCGVNPHTFDPARTDAAWMERFKTELGLHDKQVFTTVGRISSTKDYETFIRAIAACSVTTPNILGLIVGTAKPRHRHYHKKLERLVHRLHAENNILFAGPQTRLPEIYALSRAIVSCSRRPETFGLTLIEALAMNTPVIATRHGGPLDIIREGENGHFFAPGDTEGLCEQIVATLASPDQDLRTNIIQRFSTQQTAEQLIEIYQQLHRH